MLWWDEWEIEYLENWKLSLAIQAAMTMASAGLGVFFLWISPSTIWFFVLVFSALAFNMGINTFRVIQYGRRMRRDGS